MRAPTESQRMIMLEAQESLANGEMVYLSGKSDGKTTIVDAVQELIAVRKQGKLIVEPRHEENAEVVFVPRLMWPRSDKLTFPFMIRQILANVGLPSTSDQAWRLGLDFDQLLHRFHDEGRKLCLVVDNAEILPQKAFYMLKWFNEYRCHKKRKNVGTSVLWAGQLHKVNAPLSFIKHSTEIRVGKIEAAEVQHLISEAMPGKLSFFDEKAIRSMTSLSETLDIVSVAKRSLQVMRSERTEKVTKEMIDEARLKLAA